ncbi:ABC transporter substrate-binding protein [Breznakiella homolactica]|uniref:Extracellular solute-binding protein n=1 Tax=Breznakiella homolactica TaxID=2798577 RepID=A0A7T7XNH6_9SPIR|nr:extracellular solute-binding protein [Breznakiella homolactica]QQO09595.1 extracellular solute-binding protein [Breznakiella homolactica]
MKKISLILLIAACVLWAGAAVYKFTSIRNQQSQKVTITFAQYWQDETDTRFLDSLIADFEQENPLITVQVLDMSGAALQDRILGFINEEDPRKRKRNPLPDILALDSRWSGVFDFGELLLPLEQYIAGDSQLSAELAFSGAVQDEPVLIMPAVSFSYPLFYNIKLLRESGFDRPPKSREEFLAYVRTIAGGGSGIYGTALALSPENPYGITGDLYAWLCASGPAITQGNTLDFTSREAVRGLTFLSAFAEENSLDPGFAGTADREKLDSFAAGKTAMIIGSVGDIACIRGKAPELDFGVTAVPAQASYIGKPYFAVRSWYLGIPKESPRDEAAWRFISFLLGKDRNEYLASRVYGIPANGNAQPERLNHDDLYEKLLSLTDSGEGIAELYGFSQAGVLETIIREETIRMLNGEQSPEETAAAIQSRWDAPGSGD